MTEITAAPTACSELATHLGDPPRGTAPVTRLWLALEDPGPWGPAGLTESTVDAGVATAIERAATGAGVRVQLVRRRDGATGPGRTVVLARSQPGGAWLRRWSVADASELVDLPWTDLDRDEPPAVGTPADGPVVLVCTHARRDACCARYGRPVAAAAIAAAPTATWETSHTGGHRFAGNLVILPEGLVYGRLQPEDVARLLDTHRRGLIDLPRYRGRSAHPRPVQAADWFLRDRLGVHAIDAVEAIAVEQSDGGEEVTLDAAGRRYLVRVRRQPTGTARPLSCDAPGEDPGVWQLAAIDRVS